MPKKETVYDVVFDVYHLKNKEKEDKDKYRKLIRKRYEKFFPDRTWGELSRLEKDIFVCCDIKEDMLKCYWKDIDEKKVLKKIDEIMGQSLRREQYLLKQHNKKLDIMSEEVCYNPEDSDAEKKKQYNKFCKNLSSINSHIPVLGFEEWVEWNENILSNGKDGTSLNIYDYVNGLIYDDMKKASAEYTVPQAEIDHVVIDVMKKIIEEKLKIEIDVPRIEKCLSFLHNHEFEEFAEVPLEPDSSLEDEKDISKERQQELMVNDARFLMYRKTLENLDFYTEKKEQI